MALTKSAVLSILLLTVNIEFARGYQVNNSADKRKCLPFHSNDFGIARPNNKHVVSRCKRVFVETMEYAIVKIYSEILPRKNNEGDRLTCEAIYYHKDEKFELPVAWFQRGTQLNGTTKSKSKTIYSTDLTTTRNGVYRCAVVGVQSARDVFIDTNVNAAFRRKSPALKPMASFQQKIPVSNSALETKEVPYNRRTSQPMTRVPSNRTLRMDNTKCMLNQFQCVDRQKCISRFMVCNNIKNCADGSDEFVGNCRRQSPHCNANEFECERNPLDTHRGQCIPFNKVCDNQRDCSDSSDERECRKVFIKPVVSEVHNYIRDRQVSFVCETQGYPISKMTLYRINHYNCTHERENFGKIKITCNNLSPGLVDIQCKAMNNLNETYSRWFRLLIENEKLDKRFLKVTVETSPQLYSHNGVTIIMED